MSALIVFAQALATYLHDGQVDKQGVLYIEHLANVALIVCLNTDNEEVIAAAWLHDCLEDKKISYSGLRSLVPSMCYKIVLALTQRDGEEYAEYINRLHSPKFPSDFVAYRHARLIKIADLRHNLDPTRGPIKDSLRQRYEKALKKLEEANR